MRFPTLVIAMVAFGFCFHVFVEFLWAILLEETEDEDESVAEEERRRRLQAQSDAEEVEELLDSTRREQGEKRLAVVVVSCAVVSCAISAVALYTLSYE